MPYRVTYSERAKSDLHNIERYIANPPRAIPPTVSPPTD
jgi:plasmid stabilization system protein ParE